MARIRSVKPDFWHSADVCSLPRDARLLWIGLWNYADDLGRGDARPTAVKIHVFPADDDLDEAAIAGLMVELFEGDVGFELYEVDGRPYYHIPPESWDTKSGGHQRIDKPQPAKFPEPTATVPRMFLERSKNKKRSRKRAQPRESTGAKPNSKNVPGPFPDHSRGIGGIVEEGRGGKGQPPAPSNGSGSMPEDAPAWLQIVRIWRDVGEQITGDAVVLDPASHKEFATTLYRLCTEVDPRGAYEIARQVFARYWTAKHGNGKTPKMRFAVEDFPDYLRAGPSKPPEDIEAAIVRAGARRDEVNTALESARVFREVDQIAELETTMKKWDKHIAALRARR